jgi:acetoacetate decarboxylase
VRKFHDDRESEWSMPLHSPLYPNFPIEYKNVQILSTVYQTSMEAIAEHLPDQLKASSDFVIIHNYKMPDVSGMGSVEETNVMVGVQFESHGRENFGGFSTNLLINSDVGLAQGREIHGQPKKFGRTSIEIRGDTIVAEVKRNGVRVARITTPYKFQKSDISFLSKYFPFRTNINHKLIRNIDGSVAINQITARTLADVNIQGCWRGPATLVIEPHINANLYRLPVVKTLESFYWIADFNLVPGEILLDYLDKGSE